MRRVPDRVEAGPVQTPRIFVFCGSVAACLFGTHLWPQRWPVLPLALVAIAVAIWHGAFDGALAQARFEPEWGARWQPTFYLAYLGLTALIACLWWVSPAFALAAFLLYSAIHFGTEMEQQRSPGRLFVAMTTGLLPIAAACHWWPASVSTIFNAMLRNNGRFSTSFTTVCGALLWPAVAVVSADLLRERSFSRSRIVLVGTQLVLFRFCSPVSAFALYFCLWHTPEHMVSTSLSSDGRFDRQVFVRHLREGVLPWLASIVGLLVLCWSGRHEARTYSADLFIVLSALTVPHMVLAEFCRGMVYTAKQEAPRVTIGKAVSAHVG